MSDADDDLNRLLDYYRDRLEDVGLLEGAVALWEDDDLLIGVAVPVGGRRRGGFVTCATVTQVFAAYKILVEREGFPRVTVVWSEKPGVFHAVTWGEPCPGPLPPALAATLTPAEWAAFDDTMGPLLRLQRQCHRPVRAPPTTLCPQGVGVALGASVPNYGIRPGSVGAGALGDCCPHPRSPRPPYL